MNYFSFMQTYQDILKFWFEELSPRQWFTGGVGIDDEIRNRFSDLHKSASLGELFSWRITPEGRLGEIIVLDQFSRNIYRGSPLAFAQDAIALVLSQEMVCLGLDKKIPLSQRAFVYMPYMHSESKHIHVEAQKLFSIPGLEDNYKFETLHKDVIDRFGRYPHRNSVLGRRSTHEELEFLKTHAGF